MDPLKERIFFSASNLDVDSFELKTDEVDSIDSISLLELVQVKQQEYLADKKKC